MGRLLSVMLIAMVLSACGGSGNTTSTPACTPSGSWRITDTRSSSSGGMCSNTTFASTVTDVTVTVDSTAKTFTWTESGNAFAGTIDTGTCSGSVTAAISQPIGTDSYGNPITLTMAETRTISFNGGQMSGSVVAALSANTALTALPCSLNATTTGARQ